LIGPARLAMPGRMTRLLPAAVLLVSLGCSNAPIAGTLDAVWPSGGGGRDKGNTDRPSVVPDVRPPGPDVRPAPAAPAADALPPPADFFPGPRT
jgi:hypothetical protein